MMSRRGACLPRPPAGFPALFLALLLGLGFPPGAARVSAGEEGPLPAEGNTAAPEFSGRPLRRQGENPPDPPRPPGPPVPAAETLTDSHLHRPLTGQYIRQYSGPAGIAWLNGVMNRAGPYLAFIRREIERRNLPPELVYLPVIESAYLPTALSSSGAAGLWQFMKNSIAPFDMKVNDWIDERLDFWKATTGALRKLEENYHHFGDWPLALAAYNAGLGAVSRVVRDSGIRDYWELSDKKLLKNETIQYVPKLLAASHVLSNPRRYGLEPLWQEDPGWTRVPVNRMTDLELLTAAAGLEAGALKKANPELRFGVSPPEEGYMLKVRAADAAAVSRALSQKEIPLLNYYFHTLRSGDTLSELALHYGVSVAQILGANPGINERLLRIGTRLRIPALGEAVPVREERRAGETIPMEGSYQVKRGDTLWSIARAHGIDPEILAEANGMGLNDILREGRTLKTPIINEQGH